MNIADFTVTRNHRGLSSEHPFLGVISLLDPFLPTYTLQ
jgi:hypothetical protein